jgi:putative ATP-binding cassette transporter
LRDFLTTLWSTEGRHILTLLTVGIVFVLCATVAAQVALNAWNRPFYNAIQARDISAFLHQSLIFCLIAGTLLALNVAQAWLREMIKLKSRESLTRDLVAQWLKPGRAKQLANAGEIGVNPDQRIQQDTSQLTDLAAELGIGLFQASLLLLTFLGVLWGLSGAITIPIGGLRLTIPGYMVWCALLFAAIGSWLAWRVGAPLVGLDAKKYQRESGLRAALVEVNQQTEKTSDRGDQASETQRLGHELDNVLTVMRKIVTATAKVTWVTAGYGWIAIIAPIVIAAPAYFSGSLSFGELMMVVGGFQQVNQSLRWFVDNFSRVAEWGATLLRVMSFREVAADSRRRGRRRSSHRTIGRFGEKAALDHREITIGPGNRVQILTTRPALARS